MDEKKVAGTISADSLARIGKEVANECPPVTWLSAQIDAASQALSSYHEATGRQAMLNTIEAAAPGVFDATVKQCIVKYWMKYQSIEGG